jgi:hypothetical protein
MVTVDDIKAAHKHTAELEAQFQQQCGQETMRAAHELYELLESQGYLVRETPQWDTTKGAANRVGIYAPSHRHPYALNVRLYAKDDGSTGFWLEFVNLTLEQAKAILGATVPDILPA